MYTFCAQNKKPLITTWTSVAVIFSSMIFGALPYMAGPRPDTEDKLYILTVTAVAMPLFFCLCLYLKSSINNYKLKNNMKYKPFADFFTKRFYS